MALYSDLRSPGFHANYNYVVHQLGNEFAPSRGIFGLPSAAQGAVVDVAYYYQNLANMMNFGLLDELEVLPMVRTRIINLWRAIEPFVVVERKRPAPACSITVLEVLEKYAIRARNLSWVQEPR
jgi:hypothetical protein